MIEQWRELKETIIELRDNEEGTLTQQETCKFLANYMDVLEKNVSGSEKPTGSELIAKDDAISMIKELAEYHTGDSFNADRVIENIKRLPLVTPLPEQPYVPETNVGKMAESEEV